jgi:RNA polymerase sigma-70 factor (ECF subfamily)
MVSSPAVTAKIDHAADLQLAAACAKGDAAALAAFEREHLSQVGAFIARIDADAAFAEEVRQRLREKLLVAEPGQRPRIADYAGQGPLGGWVRVAAVRMALDLRKARRSESEVGATTDAAAHAVAAGADPELEIVRKRHGAEVEAAIREALAALTSRQRQLLRLAIVEGVGIDRLATMYRVHRATAARWVAAARQDLMEAVLSQLGHKLRIGRGEAHSLAGAVRSQLDISLGPLLRSG